MIDAVTSHCDTPQAGPTQMPPAEASGNASGSGSVRMKIDCQLSYELAGDCEFVFLVQAALNPDQTLVEEDLRLEPPMAYRSYVHQASGNRFLRVSAPAGALRLHYSAIVDRRVDVPDLNAAQVPVHAIPDELMHFLLPTRYCESDRLGPVAQQIFAGVPTGHARVQAICDWVHAHVAYRIGSTVATTTAVDVFVQRSGVCRDFAHLAVTFCRALNIPARLVSAYAHFDEPPPDFHAIFEAFVGGRWVLFDPSGMAPVDRVVRLATGPDAKDVAFATIYGPARMVAMSPVLNCIDGVAGSGTAASTAPPLQGAATELDL
jgi:transglutaminase-like putative cysteine protease